jgi:hypothetical protein
MKRWIDGYLTRAAHAPHEPVHLPRAVEMVIVVFLFWMLTAHFSS